MRILPMGDRALLAEVGSLGEVLALHARLEASRPDGVVDLVPAARTVLVRIDGRALTLAAARAWIGAVAQGGDGRGTDARRDASPAASRIVTLDAAYDGPDLVETAALLGLTPAAVVAQHAAVEWIVAFTGFAPGFGYLVSPDWTHDVPRLEAPRTRVPRGAIGLASTFSGAYPRETPGGWRLIATTTASLFDADAVAPASPVLLAPGTRVRFRPVAAPARETAPARAARARETMPARDTVPDAVSRDRAGLRIVDPGLLATVQDLGRPGRAALGIARSGGLDRRALRAANRLVGNTEGSAGVEVTMGGLRAVARRDTWFAVTGAWGAILLDGHPVDPYEAHEWPRDAELHLDWFAHGARAYLAVRGGIDVAPSVGARSTDLLAGLGPAALRAGDVLPVGEGAGAIPVADAWPWSPPHDDVLEVDLAPGARADWFATSALDLLYTSMWTVSAHADRVGLRLDGPELPRARGGELPSEGMVPGALQVPPSGRPTILLADGPVTGGYPVIAVVTDAALDDVAQVRPGSRIRFRHARI